MGSLFRVGDGLFQLSSDPPLSARWTEVKEQLHLLECEFGEPGPRMVEGGVLAAVRKIAEILRGLGRRGVSAPEMPQPARHLGVDLECRVRVCAEATICALGSELSDVEVATLARQYWDARIDVEEDSIARGVFVADGIVIVPDSIDEVLWALRGFDEVAEVAITMDKSAVERRRDCERILRRDVEGALGDVSERSLRAVERMLSMKG